MTDRGTRPRARSPLHRSHVSSGSRETFVVALLLAGCAGAPRREVEPVLPAPAPPLPVVPDRLEPWPDATQSPWPSPALEAREAALTSSCGAADGALARVAAMLASERARTNRPPDPDRASALLRACGEPHMRPRVVSASPRTREEDERIARRLVATKTATTRCGVAFSPPTESGERHLVVLSVEALADLDPLRLRARTGEWLTFSAKLHAAATSAKLVVLGPRGVPRTLPTSLDRATGKVHAAFALDRPGAFTVQLVATLENGPRPLLEARVFADVEPREDDEPARAPGEDAPTGSDDAATLLAMTAALRTSEALPPLRREPRLDSLARAHAERMKAERTVAHDLGEGDLALRFESAGLVASVVGENVARARGVALAFRALHASPSHRLNLLGDAYVLAGAAVVPGDDGDVYVCQVFASALR